MLTQKILIIDDDPEIVALLIDRIESFGFECYGYTSVDGAIKAVRSVKPDLIVMDVGYAQTMGNVFLNALSECYAQTDNLPPLMVSNGKNDNHIVEYAFDMGTMENFKNDYQNLPLGKMVTDFLPSDDEDLASIL